MRNGYTMIYARKESEHQRGVAIMMSQATQTQKGLIEWTAVSSCIITKRSYSHFAIKNTTVTQVYAPTNVSFGFPF